MACHSSIGKCVHVTVNLAGEQHRASSRHRASMHCKALIRHKHRNAQLHPMTSPVLSQHSAAAAALRCSSPSVSPPLHLFPPVHLLCVDHHVFKVLSKEHAVGSTGRPKGVGAGHLGKDALPALADVGLAQVVVVPEAGRPRGHQLEAHGARQQPAQAGEHCRHQQYSRSPRCAQQTEGDQA